MSITLTVASRVRLRARSLLYFKLLRMAAQACGTPVSTALLPGIIAQPPFSTNAACSYELVFFSVVRLLAESALRWNWSTQIGAIAATTALLAPEADGERRDGADNSAL